MPKITEDNVRDATEEELRSRMAEIKAALGKRNVASGLEAAGRAQIAYDPSKGIGVLQGIASSIDKGAEHAAELALKEKELAAKLQKEETPISSNELAAQASRAYNAGRYAEFYRTRNEAEKLQLPNPEAITNAQAQALSKGDILSGETYGYTITKEREGAKQAGMETSIKGVSAREAAVSGEQMDIGENGNYKGIPKPLEGAVNRIADNYRKDIAPASSVISEANKLIGMLGDGRSDVKGSKAIASVFGFMKTLDPASTVRESEFDSVAGANGILGRLANALGQVNSGVTIPAAQAAEMIGLAKAWSDAAERKVKESRDMANTLAKHLKIDHMYITGQSAYTAPSAQPTNKGRWK